MNTFPVALGDDFIHGKRKQERRGGGERERERERERETKRAFDIEYV